MNSKSDKSAGSAEATLMRLARQGVADSTVRPQARAALEAMWSEANSTRSLRRVALPAAGAALSVKLPSILGLELTAETYLLNIGLWVLVWVIVLFAADHRWSRAHLVTATGFFVGLCLAVNLFPFVGTGATLLLTASHLPVALWFTVGAARAHREWRSIAARLDFVRFSGEVLLFFALLALGGGVLVALAYQMFAGMGTAVETVIGGWVVPCGAASGLVVAAWLADNREHTMRRVAVVVQRVFTPLFALVMAVFTVTAIPSGFFSRFRRDELFVYDSLLVVVTALALYAVAAHVDESVNAVHEWALLAMTATGVAVDTLIVIAMVDRTVGMGLTPNRLAATGLNFLLLAFLVGLSWRQLRRLRGHDIAAPAEWSARYVPVVAGWCTVVALALPVAFAGA